MKYGEKLKKEIDDLGFSVNSFAKKVGVSSQSVRDIIKGNRLPSFDTHNKFCKVLSIDRDRFISSVDNIKLKLSFVFCEPILPPVAEMTKKKEASKPVAHL